MHANEDIPLPVLILWWLEVWLGLCKREPDPHVRYFPISDLGSSHFKFDLAAGLCKPGRLFQSPWKLNLSLKKPNLSIPFPADFWQGRVPTGILVAAVGREPVSFAVPREQPPVPSWVSAYLTE